MRRKKTKNEVKMGKEEAVKKGRTQNESLGKEEAKIVKLSQAPLRR